MSSVSHRGFTHLGMDVHKDSISVGILAPEDDVPEVERIFHDEASIRRLVGCFPDPRSLVACYEAGPTGYALHRLLIGMRAALRGDRPVADPSFGVGSGQDRPPRL